MQIYPCVLSLVYLPLFWSLEIQYFFQSELVAQNILCFKVNNFRTLYILTIYYDISKIRRLIQIKFCRTANIQKDLSKSNSFLTEEAINYIARTQKERRYHFCTLLSWKLKRGRIKTPTSSTFELFCQYVMIS